MTNYEGFFEPLANTDPFLKMALQGQAGDGKTFTGARVAGGLYTHLKLSGPIVIFDTEKTSKFLKPYFNQYNIPVVVKRSRSLSDLITAFEYCDAGNAPILFIDSITHVYRNFLEAFKQSKKRSFIQFQDWGIIKPEWEKQFADRFTNARFHVIFTGRQGYTYENEVDEETGRKELIKTGVKMKVETETAYEPDLLVKMERFQDPAQDFKHIHRATVIKDRSGIIDGKTFDEPGWKDFKPHVDFILSNVSEAPERTVGDDLSLIQEADNGIALKKERKAWIERIEAELDSVAYGTSKDAKALRVELKKKAFNETSDTKIESMNLSELEYGYGILCKEIAALKAQD